MRSYIRYNPSCIVLISSCILASKTLDRGSSSYYFILHADLLQLFNPKQLFSLLNQFSIAWRKEAHTL